MHGRIKIVAVIAEPALAGSVRDELATWSLLDIRPDTDSALEYLDQQPDVELALLPESADGGTAVARATELRRKHADLPVVVLSRKPENSKLTAAVRGKQISAVVPVPWRPGELLAACGRVQESSQLRRELEQTRNRLHKRLEMLSAMNELTVELADAGSAQQLARVAAQGLFRISPEGIGAVLLAQGGNGHLHLHYPQPIDKQTLHATRDRSLQEFQTLAGRIIGEDHLTTDVSGAGMSRTLDADRQYSFTTVSIATDAKVLGVIVLASTAPVNTAVEKLILFIAGRTAETYRRLTAQRDSDRRRLSQLIESVTDGLVFHDKSGDPPLLNPAARRILGIGGDAELTLERLIEVLGFDPVARLGGTPSRRATEIIRQALTIGHRAINAVVSSVPGGSHTRAGDRGVVVVLRDVTEARDLAKRQSEFVSRISHELRTPLTAIAGILDMVLKGHAGKLGDKQRRYLQLAHDSYSQLDGLIKNLLDVARSERNEMLEEVSLVDLDELSRDAVQRYQQAAEYKHIRLHLHTEERRIRILGDGGRLAQVLDNLISNAIKFTPDGGEIEVDVFGSSVVAEHVGVSVFNTGQPIPSTARERVFIKFEQLEELSTRAVGGAGLGLPISRAIIEAHGGRLWAESLSTGSRFVFILPVAPSTEDTHEERAADAGAGAIAFAESHQSGDGAAEPGIPVLVVDDGHHSGFMLSGLLIAAGYEVLTAKAVDEALTVARSQPLRLAVISISRRDGDIADLVEIFTHDPEMRKTAVLVVSPDPEVRDLAVRANADEFLEIPVEQGAFLSVCAKLVREAGHASSHRVLVVDDDSTIRMICRDILEQAGYEVTDVGDGATALEVAKRFKPDIILLDIMMPRMDGFQTAQKMRADPATAMTPIIFVSAKGETADKVRAFRAGAEDYMVKPFDGAELVARVGKSLERQARELGASPTTQLPGADAIEAEIDRRLRDGDGNDAFCYLDLDNLKAFNDYYGYAKADGVIRQIGDIIRDVVASEGSPGDFIGHIAGDDFVYITSADRVTTVSTAICATFDRLIPLYYNEADRIRGYIETRDRYKVLRRFPLMTVSVAAVTRPADAGTGFSELAKLAADGKKLAKSLGGSSYVLDNKIILGTQQDSDSPA